MGTLARIPLGTFISHNAKIFESGLAVVVYQDHDGHYLEMVT